MSGLEMNKMVAAVLTAGIVASFSGFVSYLLINPEMLAENAFPVEVVEESETEMADAEAAEPESALPLLASADVAAGQKAAKKCSACHTFDQGGANKVGPNLWNIVGRQIASAGGFSYSDVLKDKSGESWTFEHLDSFLHKPKDWAPGTSMSFAGLKKTQERADLIAYLRSLSDSPAALPEVDAAPAEEETGEAPAEAETGEESAEAESGEAPAETETAEATAGASAEPDSVLSLLASADEAAGKKSVKKCTACHTLDQGGANKIGPNLWNIVGRQIASADDYKYSNILQEKSGDSWSYENLDSYLHKPKDWAPGTKMSFAGLKKTKERADLIAYLRSLSDSPAPLPE